MGTQQSSNKQSITSKISMPQSGYRIINLQESINSQLFKLNIMTDYVIGQDPRFIDLKKLYQINVHFVQFDVFSILNYRIRKVQIPIQKNQDIFNSSSKSKQLFVQSQQSKNQDNGVYMKKQFTLGINFKFYPKINDCILRVTKIFKNSPLQNAQVKKDQYIVGLLQGDFQSMKSFVDLIKLLIESKFQYITLAICNSDGFSRLCKISVIQLQKWKQNYGVGYLGVQLAEGWLNKWQLKKHIDANKKKQINPNSNSIVQSSISLINNRIQPKVKSTNMAQNDKIQNIETSKNKKDNEIIQMKEEVDFFKQAHKISPEHESQEMQTKATVKNQTPKKQHKVIQQQKLKSISNQVKKQNQQVNQSNLQDKPSYKQRIEQNSIPQKSLRIQQSHDQNSQISSNEIEQKCNQLQQSSFEGKKGDINVIKKSKNIIEINFKDDASTICMCKDYSKHCEKCFKQKEGNYYFFNKKTNRIILIEKSMLFPKKN